jgi:hypothetical protein
MSSTTRRKVTLAIVAVVEVVGLKNMTGAMDEVRQSNDRLERVNEQVAEDVWL